MPVVRFSKPRPEIQVPNGANLMQSLLTAGLPVASSCRGDGVCAKCRIQIVSGSENLSQESELEKSLRDRHQFSKHERLSCQVTVYGDVLIDTSYW